MIGKKTVLTLGAIATSAILSVTATSLHAESACKGLEKKGCEKKESCAWVDPYTRKDGVKVSGHCRTKGGKKKASSKSSESKK